MEEYDGQRFFNNYEKMSLILRRCAEVCDFVISQSSFILIGNFISFSEPSAGTSRSQG
jgi:hypothetical protein